MTKDNINDDGERMIPQFHKGNLFYAEHMARYEATKDFVKDKVVLDIASGSGYGTKIIAATAKKVYGVDVSRDAIEYAKKHYNSPNIEYIEGDAEKIPLPDSSVDVVATFETIEHVKNYKAFLKEIRRVLRDDGIAIISTPNDLEYAEGNHFHLHEFKYEELLGLLKDTFKVTRSYFQTTWKAVLTAEAETHQTEKPLKLQVKNYAKLDNMDRALYFYIVCSSQEITSSFEPMIDIGAHLSEATEAKKETEAYEYIQFLEKENKKLAKDSQKLQELSDRLAQTEKELDDIKNSRTWKLRNTIVKSATKD